MVTRLREISAAALAGLLHPYRLNIVWIAEDAVIPGSHWGESEAGLIGDTLYVRPDTPVHSALHEACHYICMDDTRRMQLHTDAGGADSEENAVCYLQILLAGKLAAYSSARMLSDMDAWGYSFRLGSAHAWFEGDAEDARSWLAARGLLLEP